MRTNKAHGEVELFDDHLHHTGNPSAKEVNPNIIPGSSSTYHMPWKDVDNKSAFKPTTGNCCSRMTRRELTIVAVVAVVAIAVVVVSAWWCGVGVVWCGVVWCGVVWCGVVWCGVV